MFLQFLIEQKVLEKGEILSLAIDQLESMPSLLRLTLEDELLSKDQVFDVLEYSVAKKVSFHEALKIKGGLTESDLHELISRQNEGAKGFVNLMIEKGLTDSSQAKSLLNQYQEWKQNHDSDMSPQAVEGKEVAPVEEEKSGGATPISAAALESLKAVQGINDEEVAALEGEVGVAVKEPEAESNNVMLEEYLELTSESVQSELYVLANRYRLKGKESDLQKLHEFFTKMLSLSKLNQLDLHIKILKPLEEYLSLMMNDESERTEDERSHPFELLGVLWPMREVLAEGKPEAIVLNNASFKDSFIEKLKNLMILIKRMS